MREGMAMTDHGERARELFLQGYNCAQAVACAFCDVTGLTMEESARMASSFGGGLGRLRETRGTVSARAGAGHGEGYSDPKITGAKTEHYARVREFARRFPRRDGSIICRELLARAWRVRPAAIPRRAPTNTIKSAPVRGWRAVRPESLRRCWPKERISDKGA